MQRRCKLWNALVELEREHQEAVLRVLADPNAPGLVRRRARLSPAERTQLDELEAARRIRVTEARAESGLYWCNYDDVSQQYERARKQPRKSLELRGQRWNGSGKVIVRFQTGLAAAGA